jgi:excisionase family DNA binding protein
VTEERSSPSPDDSHPVHDRFPIARRILWTAEEASAALGLSERTLRDLTNAGEIPVVRLAAKLIRYSPDALTAWAIERSETGRGQAPAVGKRDGLQAGWGRSLGGKRPRRNKAPDPVRLDATGGGPAAG